MFPVIFPPEANGHSLANIAAYGEVFLLIGRLQARCTAHPPLLETGGTWPGYSQSKLPGQRNERPQVRDALAYGGLFLVVEQPGGGGFSARVSRASS